MKKTIKDRTLDLNIPKDAKFFLKEALPIALGTGFTHVILADKTQLRVDDMNDEQLVQYAFQLLPIYQSKFPSLVNVSYEH